MARLQGTVVATRGLAAHLTWKQGEMLLILADGGKPTREVADIAQMLLERDMAEGVRPMYFGVDDSSVGTTLATLQRRGLLRRDYANVWHLTPQGHEAVRLLGCATSRHARNS